MGRGQVAGNLAPGKRADFVLLPGNPKATELEGWFADLCRGTIKELEERPIVTYLAGQEVQTHKGSGTEFAADGGDFSETNAGVGMR